MAINFTFSKSGASHSAQAGGAGAAKFLVGKETVYQETKRGLFNAAIVPGAVYKPEDFSGEYGFWARFIQPTARAESNHSFVCLNTYDRARFTFGFMQYAAHVPNGDFVKFFRALLALPNAADYFPKLRLQQNRICYRESSGALTELETDATTEKLLEYLNPSLERVEEQELICAARFVHWATHDARHRRLQVKIAVEHFKKNMRQYAEKYRLDGFPANVCQVVCDIRHQGRANSQQIVNALDTGGDFEAAYNRLLQLGQPLYAARINTVRAAIKTLTDAGLFKKKYRLAKSDFV